VVLAAERLIPNQYPTVQSAVDDSNNGDVVIISPGIYRGSGNREIDLRGRAITVRSARPDDLAVVDSTIIDCELAGRAFVCCTGEDARSVIAGLTITNGHAFLGAALYCYNRSNPKIVNCVMSGNSATLGEAVACGSDSNPTIENCEIVNNSASVAGGAVYAGAASPKVINCLVAGNIAVLGGAVNCAVSNTVVHSCTFSANSASSGGGLYCSNTSNLTVQNCIFWQNSATKAPQILVSKSGDASWLTISYTDVQGGAGAAVVEEGCILNWGPGNFDAAPMFVSGPLGDFYLDPASPCVNAGSDLAADLGLAGFTTRADGVADMGIVDLGYHYPGAQLVILAGVQINPPTLNLAGKARYLVCHIRLPADYDAADIDSYTVLLADQLEPEWLGINRDEAGCRRAVQPGQAPAHPPAWPDPVDCKRKVNRRYRLCGLGCDQSTE
jgi:predicted outer membrane repeat protein